MPNKNFAKKRDRQQKKRRLVNRVIKKQIRTAAKKIHTLYTEGKKEELVNFYDYYQKLCDKAAKKGVLHQNTSARRKSNAAKILKSMDNKS